MKAKLEKYSYNYAKLDGCIEATINPLSQNGLAVTHQMDAINGRSILETTLSHISGEFFKSYTDITALNVSKNIIYFLEAALKYGGTDFLNKIDVEKMIYKIGILNPWQDEGKAVTYMRKITYLGIIGVAAAEDDDGNSPNAQIQHKNGINSDFTILKKMILKELMNKIELSGVDPKSFASFHKISRDDVLMVKKSIDNFDELLIKFRESNSQKELDG
jgi:hypothetical protein